MNDLSDPSPNGAKRSLVEALRDGLRALRKGASEASVRDTLEEIIEERGDADTPMDVHERLLLANILHMRDVTAADVMVPRADMEAVEFDTPLKEVTKQMAKIGHSRLPVYRKTLDDVVGMVHIKDLLGAVNRGRTTRIGGLLRGLRFVSPTMRVMDLLNEMRLERYHMALVVDEYGGIDGLVTIEDLVEQIVGEIEDEHDTENEPTITVHTDGTLTADARVTVEEFEKHVGSILSQDERDGSDTLGGLVFHIADRVPARGELVRHTSGFEFEILQADPRRVKKLKVRPPPLPPEEGD
ncbi:MAG: magnesium/cobalt efflux protein [Alphaproteobacteria bacterium RIFOXYD12_FULL_60_8]|nr:MAG: magnesium/cobalt efflux protein [Alphaproteobacteria bacterium RIFOXYD12_FULL_60_8]